MIIRHVATVNAYLTNTCLQISYCYVGLGGPNFSMVSVVSNSKSMNPFTPTLKDLALLALNILKRSNKYFTEIIIKYFCENSTYLLLIKNRIWLPRMLILFLFCNQQLWDSDKLVKLG